MKKFKNSKYYAIIIALVLIFAEVTGLTGITDGLLGNDQVTIQDQSIDKTDNNMEESIDDIDPDHKLDKNKAYYSKDDVASYIKEYGELPVNYLTKDQASDLGWDPSEGNLWDVTDKGVIGGDSFGNFEGLLPKKSGRMYFEADVNYRGGRRNVERLVYSNDGLIYYTSDHYASFEEIVGE